MLRRTISFSKLTKLADEEKVSDLKFVEENEEVFRQLEEILRSGDATASDLARNQDILFGEVAEVIPPLEEVEEKEEDLSWMEVKGSTGCYF